MLCLPDLTEEVQQSVLGWFNTFDLPQPLSKLHSIVDCQVILVILQRVKRFTLTQKLPQKGTIELTLSDKVSRMKILVKSIIRYYQAELLRDVSEMKLNIVQMCIGNKQEIIRFVLLLVGIIANEECCREQLEIRLQQLKEQDRKLFWILLQCAARIGEERQKESESPVKRQKMIIEKLEMMEADIETLECKNQQLVKIVEEEREDYSQLKSKWESCHKQLTQCNQKLQRFQMAQQKLQFELRCKQANEELLESKIKTNKAVSKAKIRQLSEEKAQLQSSLKVMAKKYQTQNELQLINDSLKDKITNLQSQVDVVRKSEAALKDQLKEERERYLCLHKKYQLELLELEQFKSKASILLQEKLCERRNVCRQLLNESSDRRWITKDSLSYFKSNKKDEMDAANEILKENNDQFEEILKLSLGKNESLACTIRSNVYKSFSRVSPTKVPAEQEKHQTGYFENIEEQKSVDLSEGNLQQLSEKELEECPKDQQQNSLSKALKNNAKSKDKNRYTQQITFLVGVICTLQDQIKNLQQEMYQNQLKEQKQAERMILFNAKVTAMFAS